MSIKKITIIKIEFLKNKFPLFTFIHLYPVPFFLSRQFPEFQETFYLSDNSILLQVKFKAI